MSGTDDDRRPSIIRAHPLGFIGTVVAAVVAALIVGVISGPSGSPSTSPQSSGTSSSTSPKQKPLASTTPPALSRAVYLDTVTETTGAQVIPGQVSIGGRTYQHGIQFNVGFVESTVEADYSIPQRARTFSVAIGNDDNQPNQIWAGIPLLYEVFVNGRRVATGHARGSTHDRPLHANVAGGSTIALKVTNIGDAGGGTNADWADPVFH